MRKKIASIIFATGVIAFALTGCNKDIFDTNYKYDKAIINLSEDEVIEVDVKQWKDYDGEQIQIIAQDGTIYLTSSFNCTLIREKE